MNLTTTPRASDSDLFFHSVSELLRGAPLASVLAPVLESADWHALGSHVSICWHDGQRRQHVSTGLCDSLSGVRDGGPWAEARRTHQRIQRCDLADLDVPQRARAEACGRGGYWIEPVTVSGHETATITVWTAPGVDPMLHEEIVHKANRYVGLVLEFAAHRRALDHAASHDPLTGLANRAALLEAMAAEEGGALLYCDLDRFKPVNDQHGHAAGDQLLALVAQRLRACVRAGDLVARIGGDEFVVLCRTIDRADAERLGSRILDALSQPFALGDVVVDIGSSVGLAFEQHHIDEATLVAADQALYAAKAAGRGVLRWADDAHTVAA